MNNNSTIELNLVISQDCYEQTIPQHFVDSTCEMILQTKVAQNSTNIRYTHCIIGSIARYIWLTVQSTD